MDIAPSGNHHICIKYGLKNARWQCELHRYCGIYCGACPGYKSAIADLAGGLRKELSAENIDSNAEKMAQVPAFEVFKQYPAFCQALEMLANMRCPKICREGGGNPECPLRLCCKEKEITGCWQCADFETCDKLDFLKVFIGDEVVVNLVTLREEGIEAYIRRKQRLYNILIRLHYSMDSLRKPLHLQG